MEARSQLRHRPTSCEKTPSPGRIERFILAHPIAIVNDHHAAFEKWSKSRYPDWDAPCPKMKQNRIRTLFLVGSLLSSGFAVSQITPVSPPVPYASVSE